MAALLVNSSAKWTSNLEMKERKDFAVQTSFAWLWTGLVTRMVSEEWEEGVVLCLWELTAGRLCEVRSVCMGCFVLGS